MLSDFVGMVEEVALWEGDVAEGVGCHFKSGDEVLWARTEGLGGWMSGGK